MTLIVECADGTTATFPGECGFQTEDKTGILIIFELGNHRQIRAVFNAGFWTVIRREAPDEMEP